MKIERCEKLWSGVRGIIATLAAMDKMERDEKLWGGILGIIAILAAVVEMFLNGPDAASFVGAVKDVSGTLIVVILLVAFLKNLPRRPKNLTEILEKAVEDWGLDNAPLIFKAEGYVAAKGTDYTQGFVLLQDSAKYIELTLENINKDSANWSTYAKYDKSNRRTGKFINFPSYEDMTTREFDVLVVMEQAIFKKEDKIEANIQNIKNAVSRRFESYGIGINRVGNSNQLRFTYPKINTENDVNVFVDSMDFLLSLVKVIM